jgi:hypothetical protein
LKLRKTLRDSDANAKPSLKLDASPVPPPASKRVDKERDRRPNAPSAKRRSNFDEKF